MFPAQLEQLVLPIALPLITEDVQLKVPPGIVELKGTLQEAPLQIVTLDAEPTGIGLTVTFCKVVVVFPCPSFAVQVTAVIPNGNTEGALLVYVTVPQLSFPVGVPKERVTPEVKLQVEISAGATIMGTSASV